MEDQVKPETVDQPAPAPAAPVVTETPKKDWLLRFVVNGHAFVFRRQSRADIAAAKRRFVGKLCTADSALLSVFDDGDLWAEAILEIGLATRLIKGEVVDLGECCPPHWKRGDAVVFDEVEPSEFASVIQYLGTQGVSTTMPAPSPGPALG